MTSRWLHRCALTGLVAASCLSWASNYGFIEILGGPRQTSAVTGNGRLTVGTNEFGQIVSFRWPGPGHANQVSGFSSTRNTEDSASRRGMSWGIRSGEQIIWLDAVNLTQSEQTVDQNLPLIRTASHVDGLAGAAFQEAFVHSDVDILVARLRISLETEGEPVWYADASPHAALAPELPFLDALWSAARDFAAFVDGSVVYHVRPALLDSRDWDEARRWAGAPETAAPEVFNREGVWMAYTSPDGILAAVCDTVSDSGKESGYQSGGVMAFGDCASSAAPRCVERDGERIATIVVAVGRSREEVDANIALALEQGFDGLLSTTRDAWSPVLEGAAQQISPTASELRPLLTQALATVFAATSQESGAIVRVPGAQPMLALDYPRHSIWAGLALDYLGLSETSERHLGFLLSQVRTENGAGMPTGSIPAALYGDGTPALPHVVLDADAAGWLLWAIEQHSRVLDETERESFMAEAWPHVQNLASLLLARSDPGFGIPLYSFDPRSLKDAATEECLIAHCIGLQSAAALARIIGEHRPEWETRVEELEDDVTSRAFTSEGTWSAQRPLSIVPTGILGAYDPRWEPVSEQTLENINRVTPGHAMRDLCDLAFLWRDQPERLRRLKPFLVPVITRANAARPLDTLDAARAILSILMVCGE